MIFLTNINLSTNELQNAVIQPLVTAPSAPKLGQIYYNSTTNKIMQYDGTKWTTVGMIVEDATAGDGVITVDGVDMTVYTLPIASATTLGGIRVGTGLNIDAATGTVSVSGGASVESANKLTTARTIALGGDLSGSASFDGTKDITIDATILNKPTKLSDFENDEGFITNTVNNLTNYWTSTQTQENMENYVQQEIGKIATIQIQVVDELPATGQSNIIYLVPNSGSGNNVYDEYLWTGEKFELIGTTQVDLSNYLQKNGDGSNVYLAQWVDTDQYPTHSGDGDTLKYVIGYLLNRASALKTVATTGSYNDLTDKPNLVQTTTLTISPTSTSASSTAGFFTGKTILSTIAFMTTSGGQEQVQVDISNASGTLTASIAQAVTNIITVSYTHLRAHEKTAAEAAAMRL